MNKLAIAGVASLCVLFLSPNVTAQMGRGGMTMSSPQGIFNPVVGAGAEYEMDSGNGTKTTMQIGIVGKESSGGKDGYWFETVAGSPQGQGSTVMKMLIVPGDTTQIPKMIMQMPGRGPMEMDGMMAGRMTQNQQPKDIRDIATDIGSESVTVPAGTFTCEHYKAKNGDGDYWISKDVPPYGMVKIQSKNLTMVLVKALSNFQDQITGTPMDMSQMMRGMAQPPTQ